MGLIPVLYCIDRLVPGGTEKQLIRLLEHLDRSRFRPHLCTFRPSVLAVPELDPTDCLELPFQSFASPRLLSHLRTFRAFIREHDIQLIQTFFQDPMILAGLACLGRRSPRLIGTFRDLGFWRTLTKRCEIRAVLPMYDGFIANAHAVAHFFQDADNIPLEKFHVIYNGVGHFNDVTPAERPRPGVPAVGIVANFDRPVKRVDLFIDAARRVLDTVEDADFILVGDGCLKPRLLRQTESLGLTERVHFMGSVPDPAPYVAALSVGVICSDSEGLSNAILEYMATGVPVVATDVGGNPELIQPGVTGLLVPPGDAQGLADAIVRLLRDRALAQGLARAAQARIRQDFSFEQFARNHEQVYAQVLTR